MPSNKRRAAPPTPPRSGPSSKGRKLQMQDIARMAGVSTSTVSRALNESSLVNQATRARIRKLADSLQYSINVGARNLRLQTNRTVAVVVPFDPETRQQISDPFFVALLGHLADTLTERGYDMLISRVDANRLDLCAAPATSGRAVGVILIGQWYHHDQLNELAVQRVPFVVWGAQLPNQLYCTIGSDNVAGGELATRHLLDSGRRRIAFFGDVELPEVAQRFAGYERALRAQSIGVIPALLRRTAFTADSAQRAVNDLFQSGTSFDAVFASSDLLAMSTIGALRERGVEVPKGVAVVGYDDIELAVYSHPALTTIRQPIADGARALIDSLLHILDGERPRPVVLPTELIVRESSSR